MSSPIDVDPGPRGPTPRRAQGSGRAEEQILAATERLLATTSLTELSVVQIVDQAGVSRMTFYSYFPSKYAVVLALLRQVLEELQWQVQPFLSPVEGMSPAAALHVSLSSAAAMWARNRHVLRAISEHWAWVDELGELLLAVFEVFVVGTAARIDGDRAAGLAPDGPPSRQLATTLLWGTERALYVAGLGRDKDLPSETEIVDTLTAHWVGTIYGTTPRELSRRRLPEQT